MIRNFSKSYYQKYYDEIENEALDTCKVLITSEYAAACGLFSYSEDWFLMFHVVSGVFFMKLLALEIKRLNVMKHEKEDMTIVEPIKLKKLKN